MATKKDLDIQKQIAEAAEKAAKHAKEAAAVEQDKVRYQSESLRQSLSARKISKDQYLDSQKRAREEAEITKQKKEQAKTGKTTASLTQKINKLLDSGAGTILKQANLTSTLENSMKGAQDSIGDLQKGYNLISDAQLAAVEAIKNGTFDATSFMDDLGEQFEGMSDEAKIAFQSMGKDLDEFAKDAEKAGKGLENALRIDAKTLDGLDGMRDKLKEYSAIASSPKLMGAAAIGLLVKLMTDFANKALEVRQSLGTTAVESAKVAVNMTVAGTQAKIWGGSSQEAEAAVTGMVDEFGSLSVLSVGVSQQLGSLVGQFGMAGAGAAKLLKTMESISGASIETNIALLKSVGELARAEGVAPAQVLNDIAENTETFAQFAKDGGKNIAAAAIQARKLGLNLATVAGIAESLLDFETSIEKQMEASMLIGRQLNLDKARELSLAGDLEGLQKEILTQVGSQAEFEAMNVVQRKALADSIGVSVGDMAKMVAGEKTSAQVAEEREETQQQMAITQEKMMQIMMGTQVVAGAILAVETMSNVQKALSARFGKKAAYTKAIEGGATIATAAAESGFSAAKVPIIGPVLALAAIAAVGAAGWAMLNKKPTAGLQKGGLVGKDAKPPGPTDTVPAMLTPGELVLNAAQQKNLAAGLQYGAVMEKPGIETAGLQEGGEVTQTGMAEIHEGEVFSGTKNEMGFGGTNMEETNRLLKQSLEESKAIDMTETNRLLKKQLTETVLFREQNKKDMAGLGYRIKVLELTNF